MNGQALAGQLGPGRGVDRDEPPVGLPDRVERDFPGARQRAVRRAKVDLAQQRVGAEPCRGEAGLGRAQRGPRRRRPDVRVEVAGGRAQRGLWREARRAARAGRGDEPRREVASGVADTAVRPDGDADLRPDHVEPVQPLPEVDVRNARRTDMAVRDRKVCDVGRGKAERGGARTDVCRRGVDGRRRDGLLGHSRTRRERERDKQGEAAQGCGHGAGGVGIS